MSVPDTNQKKWIHDRLEKSECRKLAWNYQIFVVNGEIRVEKEINIWLRDGIKWCRIYYDCFPLEWFNCSNGEEPKSMEYNSQLFVNRDAIQFNGGYLKIVDPGLVNQLKDKTDLRFDKESQEFFSNLFLDCVPEKLGQTELQRQEPVGRNIHIEVEVDLDSPTFSDSIQPLFYLPQGSNKSGQDFGYVYLSVKQNEDRENQLSWEISKTPYNLSNPYELEGMHRIVVSQDTNWLRSLEELKNLEGNDPLVYFEYYVNSMALNKTLAETPAARTPWGNILVHKANIQHKFSVKSKEFYVGYNPEHNELFHGKIRKLFFDPNATCPECIP